jgi:hypothetical protein
VADAAPPEDPVMSKIWEMISAFLLRLVAFRPRALAIANNCSLSLDSSWDCSSACAATLTYFARENAKGDLGILFAKVEQSAALWPRITRSEDAWGSRGGRFDLGDDLHMSQSPREIRPETGTWHCIGVAGQSATQSGSVTCHLNHQFLD